MYFWKIEELKNDIRSGEFTEKDRFSYVFCYLVLTDILLELSGYWTVDSPTFWDYISSILTVIIGAAGVVCGFKANGASVGHDFLGKFFSIGFVVSIKFFVYLIALLILEFVLIFFNIIEGEWEIPESISGLVFSVWYVGMYWYICKHIKDVRTL